MSSAVEIALFPIPQCVTFPGTTFPLHVFEPRYRAMVKHCMDNNMLLGICHTRKLLSPGKTDQTINEALRSNQATYKPFDVFSAGYCQLLKTLEDGRMYLRVPMENRYKVVKELQTLPFSICECEIYQDSNPALVSDVSVAQEKILHRLQVMANRMPEVRGWLESSTWTEKDPIAFSFEIFGYLQFDADLQQEILEMRSPAQRLEYLLNLLNNSV